MGSWGTGVFDNDDVGDFLLVLEEEPSSFKEEVEYIYAMWSEDGYIEAPEGNLTLAMGELILIAKGVRPEDPTTEDIDLNAIKAQLNPELLSRVTRLIRAVLNRDNSEGSELYELWAEASPDSFAAWKQAGKVVLDKLEQLG